MSLLAVSEFLDHFYVVEAELRKSVYTKRFSLWELYGRHCNDKRKPEMNQHDKAYTHQGAFGRIIVKVFPTLVGRRLGPRGNQKYYYEGLACYTDSPYYEEWLKSMRYDGALKATYTTKPDTVTQKFEQFLCYAKEYLKADSHGEISRQELFLHYLRVCRKRQWFVMSHIAFGRAIMQTFKKTRVRRLNTIHCMGSHYTFGGIAYRTKAMYKSPPRNDENHDKLWVMFKKDLLLEGSWAKRLRRARKGKEDEQEGKSSTTLLEE